MSHQSPSVPVETTRFVTSSWKTSTEEVLNNNNNNIGLFQTRGPYRRDRRHKITKNG